MRNPDIIPPKDGEFDLFQKKLMRGVIENQLAWNIPPQEITVVEVLQAAWDAAWSINKANRTPAQTKMKMIAKKNYVAQLRLFIKRFIRHNSAVSASNLVAMGIKPLVKHKTRIPKPDTIPGVSLMPAFVHKVEVFFRQFYGEGMSRRAMPKGVQFCQLALSINNVTDNPDGSMKKIQVTRSPHTLEFTPQQAGSKLIIYARWMNARGETGGWSPAKELVIP